MIRDRNIVCVANNWFDHPTSKHHLMRILSERNHILWVSYHASRRPKLNRTDTRMAIRRLRQASSGWCRVCPTIDVLSPLLLPFPGARLARRVNARGLARQIKAALHRLPERPTQLWLFTPDVPALISLLPCERVVYYCVDDFAAFSGCDEALIARLEAQTISASDVVITTSTRLYEDRKNLQPNTHLVPHGVDYDHFATAADVPPEDVPDDVRHVARPVFGYVGLISDYVDVELLGAAARRKPEWSFVLIGDVRRDVRAVRGLNNVHLLGGRPYESLPGYCSHFDVGLIPFRLDRLTRAVNPIKLREYLAAGLPVVSTPMPEVLRYAPVVHTAESLDEFMRACSAALGMAGAGNRRARQELVRAESWRSKVELLSDIVSAGRAACTTRSRRRLQADERHHVGKHRGKCGCAAGRSPITLVPVAAGVSPAVDRKKPENLSALDRPLPCQGSAPLTCLTVDVEEYFHCEAFAGCIRPTDWPRLERRAAPFVEWLGELLQRHESRATFFVLGWMVDGMAPLLRHLASEGHEIACHGYAHDHLARMTPHTLRQDLQRARGRIEDALSICPIGYRAPTFSVTRSTAWALDVIIEQGFEYDASIFPIRHDRYGVPDAPVRPFWAVAPSGARILEFPPLTLDWRLARFPVGGGGYLRLLPDTVLRGCIARRERRRQPALIYVHPWELDPRQPRFDVGVLSQWRHGVNLWTTRAKVQRLLSAFRFDTVRNVLTRVRQSAALPVFELAPDPSTWGAMQPL